MSEKFEFAHHEEPKLDQFKQVEKLGSMGCTQSEAAGFFEISLDTFKRRLKDQPGVREAWDRGKEKGRVELRQAQWDLAKKGNVAMLIWLGKQLLGQKDKSDFSSGGEPLSFHIKMNGSGGTGGNTD